MRKLSWPYTIFWFMAIWNCLVGRWSHHQKRAYIKSVSFKIKCSGIDPTHVENIFSYLNVRVRVNFREWTRVDNFESAGSHDKVYTIDRDSGTLIFGDGENGKIPPTGSVISANFNNENGAAVDIGTITSLQSSAPYISSVFNCPPASGGADTETIEFCIRVSKIFI